MKKFVRHLPKFILTAQWDFSKKSLATNAVKVFKCRMAKNWKV